MNRFSFSHEDVSGEQIRRLVADETSGAYVAFEGWVRNHNEGQQVLRLEYEAFESLGTKEGERIIREAEQRFGISTVYCVHRLGKLEIGDLAVIVGVSTPHRGEAFEACRYIIDEVKHRVPVWKKEHYVNGDSGWVNCERCAAAAHQHDHGEH
ncbi:MAG: molybdopterin-converting factor chain 2 [Chromatiales bacterium]|jgi:molybdopterin synthase catalytic subunit|nr:molybdopterin-converting factor chain 2 [Chromatiales bacterium]